MKFENKSNENNVHVCNICKKHFYHLLQYSAIDLIAIGLKIVKSMDPSSSRCFHFCRKQGPSSAVAMDMKKLKKQNTHASIRTLY